MPMDLSRLTSAVERDTTVNQSAITLLTDLSQRLRDAVADQANAVQNVLTLADQLDANQQALADAVAANTPAAEPTPPTPPTP